MKKCRYAGKYKGLVSPKCNKGFGCDTCNAIYKAKHCRHNSDNWAMTVDGEYVKCQACGLIIEAPSRAHLFHMLMELAKTLDRKQLYPARSETGDSILRAMSGLPR